jgi:hypothetical protein
MTTKRSRKTEKTVSDSINLNARSATSGILYDVNATVSAAIFNLLLKIDGQNIRMSRNADRDWEANVARLDLNDPASVSFRAVGMPGDDWTLSITLTPSDKTKPITFSHSDTIPDNLVSDLTDKINLT